MRVERPTQPQSIWRSYSGRLLHSGEEALLDWVDRFRDGSSGSKILLTSAPKAGTHLLMGALNGLLELRRRPLTLEPYQPWQRHAAQLARMAGTRFAWGHLAASPPVLRMAARMDLRVVVMLRDPRDVVISFVDHVCRLKPHVLRAYFESLPDEAAKLRAAIVGAPAAACRRDEAVVRSGYYDGYTGFADIGTVLRSYLLWEQHPRVIFSRFETLVGERGGGTRERQRAEIARIASFLGLQHQDSRIEGICDRLFDQQAATFNVGRAGRWRELFDADARAIFEEVAGAELRRLGYADNGAWG
ncbi:MAG: sulfotransferase domain-containing protein [Acidobacteria bacterium]|nr:sulfotransferase domain-containing protein [Acidobacteriota bacterium]